MEENYTAGPPPSELTDLWLYLKQNYYKVELSKKVNLIIHSML